MHNTRSPKLEIAFLLTLCLSLAACGSGPARYTPGPPATLVYMVDSAGDVVGYSTGPGNNGLPVTTLTLPPPCGAGIVASDSAGRLYVYGCGASEARVYVYPPNPNGATTPLREIEIDSSEVSALAADPAGAVYAIINNGAGAPSTVLVYSATANGAATALRTLQLADFEAWGIAADPDGTIYVAGAPSGSSAGAIAVYSPTANGVSIPARTITFGNFANVYGVAVDPAGDIFASACPSECTGTTYAVEEFAPGASGQATPINVVTILDVPVASPTRGLGGGPVYVDGGGNVFTSLNLISVPTNNITYVIEGFGPTATGNAAPTVEISGTAGQVYGPGFAIN